MDASAVLMKRLSDRAQQNPAMALGQSFLNGNMAQGMQDMAQSRMGPQMQFAQTLFNPESTMGDRVGGYFDMVDEMSRRRRGMQPNQPGTTSAMVQPAQQGLLPYMSMMG
jgi:hypothetical protein